MQASWEINILTSSVAGAGKEVPKGKKKTEDQSGLLPNSTRHQRGAPVIFLSLPTTVLGLQGARSKSGLSAGDLNSDPLAWTANSPTQRAILPVLSEHFKGVGVFHGCETAPDTSMLSPTWRMLASEAPRSLRFLHKSPSSWKALLPRLGCLLPWWFVW